MLLLVRSCVLFPSPLPLCACLSVCVTAAYRWIVPVRVVCLRIYNSLIDYTPPSPVTTPTAATFTLTIQLTTDSRARRSYGELPDNELPDVITIEQTTRSAG